MLVPNIPSVCQAITSENTGLIYINEDLNDAGRKLNQLMNDRHLRESMGAAAKQAVLEKYTMKTTDSQFSAALEIAKL